MSLNFHVTPIDDETRLVDHGDTMILEQLDELGELQQIHVTPEKAVAIAAAIMSRLNA